MLSTAASNRNQKRRLAVAQGADDARQQIVEEGAGHPDEGDQQVLVGSVEDKVGRAHPPQDVGTQQAGDCRYHHRHHCRQLQAHRDASPHGAVVVCAELLSHGDAESTATSVAKS